MRKKRFISLKLAAITLLFITISSFAEDNVDAYIDKLTAPCSVVQPVLWEYVKTIAHSRDMSLIKDRHSVLVNRILKSKKEVNKLSGFQGDNSLKNSAITYLDSLYYVLTQNYKELVDMKKISEESYDKMEAYLKARNEADKKLQQATDKYNNDQVKFARSHNMELTMIETEVFKKLQIALEVDRYYQKVYLIFFKPYKQEFYCLNDVSRNDVESFKKNRILLKQYTKNALKQLNTITPYKNQDSTIIDAARELLEFYAEETENDFETTSRFFLLKTEFDTAKNSIEIKKQNKSEITQSDIDQYNLKLEEFNSMVNKVNNASGKSNSKRSILINNFNRKTFEFYNNNVPH